MRKKQNILQVAATRKGCKNMRKIKSDEAKKERVRKGLNYAMVFIPVILIAVLLIVLIRGRMTSSGRPGFVKPVAAEGSGIVIKQNSSEKSKGLIKTKNVVEIDTIEEGLRDMGFLITEEYYFTDVLTQSKKDTIPIINIEESYSLKYDGYITAGIEFGEIGIAVDRENKVVTLTMPEAVIKDTVIDPDSVEILGEKHSLFIDINEEDRAEAMKEFKKVILEKANEKGILKRASDNAKNVARNFAVRLLDPDYRIEFAE